MPSQAPLMELKGITKTFPGVQALKEVDFSISPGEVVSLVGMNGAGKSTLMSIIGGILNPDEGTIAMDGEEVKISTPAVAEHLGVGFVHQEPMLVPGMTVAANIFLNRERRRARWFLDFREMQRESRRIAALLGFDLDPNRLVGELSLVEAEVVEIAKAMLLNPSVLILDEMTAPLDPSSVDRLFELIGTLRDQGMAIIFISHRLDEVVEISDRVVVLRDGLIVGDIERDESLTEKVIIDLMIGDNSSVAASRRANPAEDPTHPLLEVSGMSYAPLYRDVSFSIKRGEILGFAGLRGSGISAILATLFGAISPDSGEVHLSGSTLDVSRPLDAIRSGIGMLSNDRHKEGLALSRSVGENIVSGSFDKLSGRFGRVRASTLQQRGTELAKRLAIKTPSVEEYVLNLSGGNQQKVVMAKWVLRDLDVLIVDEPTRGVDVRAKSEIYELLFELANQGKAVLIHSPEIPELLALCDRILVVSSGRITAEVHGLADSFNQADVMDLLHSAAASDMQGEVRDATSA